MGDLGSEHCELSEKKRRRHDMETVSLRSVYQDDDEHSPLPV